MPLQLSMVLILKPIKAVLEALGYKVTWQDNTRRVHAVSVK